MTNVALTTLTKVGRMASHGVTLGVTKGVKKGVKLKLIASLHLVISMNLMKKNMAFWTNRRFGLT